jgi:hypothetical protein
MKSPAELTRQCVDDRQTDTRLCRRTARGTIVLHTASDCVPYTIDFHLDGSGGLPKSVFSRVGNKFEDDHPQLPALLRINQQGLIYVPQIDAALLQLSGLDRLTQATKIGSCVHSGAQSRCLKSLKYARKDAKSINPTVAVSSLVSRCARALNTGRSLPPDAGAVVGCGFNAGSSRASL